MASLTIGVSVATRMLMIRITARSSISVKPRRRIGARRSGARRSVLIVVVGEPDLSANRSGANLAPRSSTLADAPGHRLAPAAGGLGHGGLEGVLLAGLLPGEAIAAEVAVEG